MQIEGNNKSHPNHPHFQPQLPKKSRPPETETSTSTSNSHSHTSSSDSTPSSHLNSVRSGIGISVTAPVSALRLTKPEPEDQGSSKDHHYPSITGHHLQSTQGLGMGELLDQYNQGKIQLQDSSGFDFDYMTGLGGSSSSSSNNNNNNPHQQHQQQASSSSSSSSAAMVNSMNGSNLQQQSQSQAQIQIQGQGQGLGKDIKPLQGGKDKEKEKEKENGKTKRIPSCDICRMRKVKCVKPPPDQNGGGNNGDDRCAGCKELDRACTYEYRQKKPGPVNGFSRSALEGYAPYPQQRNKLPTISPSIKGKSTLGTSPSEYPRPIQPRPPPPTHSQSQSQSDMSLSDLPLVSPHSQHGSHLSMDMSQNPYSSLPPPPTNDFRSMAMNPPQTTPGNLAQHHQLPQQHTQQQQQQQHPPHPPNPLGIDPSPGGSNSNGMASPDILGLGLGGLTSAPPSTGRAGPFDLPDRGLPDDMFMPWICSTEGGGVGMNIPFQTGGGGTSDAGPSSSNGLLGLVGNGTGNASSAFPGGNYDWDALTDPALLFGNPTSDMRNGMGLGNAGNNVNGNFDSAMGGGPSTGGSNGNNNTQQAFMEPHNRFGSTSAIPHHQPGNGSISSAVGDNIPQLPTRSPRGSESLAIAGIENVTRWSTVLTFLGLYFEHLYPLLPLMHWPSFSQQLIARQDKKDPVFRSFLLSLVAYSILQLPKSVIPPQFTQIELSSLHLKCHIASRKLQPRLYEPLQLIHISTLYCDHIYLGSTGKDNAANAVLSEAMRLAIALGLHDDSVAVGQGMDAIEQETRRRVFWILYGSDRTIAALISCPLLLSDDDIFVSEPLEVDDSLITAAGSFQQPPNRTPVISGFVHVTRIFRLLSHVLRLVRRRARTQSNPLYGLTDMILEGGNDGGFPDPRSLIRSLQRLLEDFPPPLRLKSDVHEQRSPQENNAFETCKANLLVSQVLVRFAIYQYAMLRTGPNTSGQERPEQYLDELTEDVLKTLHCCYNTSSMSSESLAANGESIRRKVLFIASSLLNKYPAGNEGSNHVQDFLNVYNKILLEQTQVLQETEGLEEYDS